MADCFRFRAQPNKNTTCLKYHQKPCRVKLLFSIELPLLHWKILQARHHMKELCKWNVNCSLLKLISFKETIGREGHFIKKDTFVHCKILGVRALVPPGSYVSVSAPS